MENYKNKQDLLHILLLETTYAGVVGSTTSAFIWVGSAVISAGLKSGCFFTALCRGARCAGEFAPDLGRLQLFAKLGTYFDAYLIYIQKTIVIILGRWISSWKYFSNNYIAFFF